MIRDIPEQWQLGLQDPASPVMEVLVKFHDYINIYLSFILVGVSYMLVRIVWDANKRNRYISHKYMVHGTVIELVWTITPALILVAIAYPSFKLLYLLDEVIDSGITIKTIGHQWYWSYEYSDYATQDGTTINFDSYMIPDSDLELGQFRLLEVDNRVVIPVDTHVRMVVGAADVLHSWAVPSLGIKLDAIPGRLNQVGFIANREGTFYGQCSEICGVGHSQMPIVVQAVKIEDYINYIENWLEEERS